MQLADSRLTDSLQQSPSKANSSLASQKFRLRLWNPIVYFRAHNSPPLVHTIPYNYPTINFNFLSIYA